MHLTAGRSARSAVLSGRRLRQATTYTRRRKSEALHRYIARRLLALPFVILVVSILVFSMTRLGGTTIGPYLEPGMTARRSPLWKSGSTSTSRCPCSTWPGSPAWPGETLGGRRSRRHRL